MSCPGCGLAAYEGFCPHCRGDQEAYERELVPPFPSSLPERESWPCEACGEQEAQGMWNPDGLGGHETLVCSDCYRALFAGENVFKRSTAASRADATNGGG